ncbi:hypothetical protein LSH36_1693g00002 [Paralvinella palmiformis]|uniref:Ionotropic glutamate receptor C-terminal domain-containing protein n=1 Tax=Paralvinella palmiformis TaxID=53620 RepID=A0AAD9IS24_9ANNE|nr:hypothetical protein LSH36_1693g00002 [Paralvinella palmiformis]
MGVNQLVSQAIIMSVCQYDNQSLNLALSDEESHSFMHHIRLNWVLLTITLDILTIVNPLLRDGDNLVVLTRNFVPQTMDEYLAEANLAVGGITIISSREAVIDFTTPFTEVSVAVILRLHAHRWDFIYSVFNPTVWLCIGCLPVLITLSSYVAYTLVATYSGNLTSRLAVTKVKMPFINLQGLADDTKYTLVIVGNTSTELLLKNSKKGIYKKLWDKIQTNPERSLVKSTAEGWKKLENEEHIALSARKSGLTQNTNDKIQSDVILLPEEYFPSSFGLIMQQGAPYKRRFDRM